MTYTIQYFIDKFSAIPVEQWRSDGYYGKDGEPHCALGHLGCLNDVSNDDLIDSTEISDLYKYLAMANVISIVDLNDGRERGFHQTTPKDRIIAALEIAKSS